MSPPTRILCWALFLALIIYGAAGAFFPTMIIPASGRPHSQTDQTLRALRQALLRYAEVHDGQFPSSGRSSTENLWELYPNYTSDALDFWDPQSGVIAPTSTPARKQNAAARLEDEWIAATGFIYFDGYSLSSEYDDTIIVAYARKTRGECRTILKRNLRVETIYESDFQKRIVIQSAILKNASPSANPPSSVLNKPDQ